MEPGKLRHSILLERRVDTVNTSGDTIPQWVALPSVRAKFHCPSGRDYMLQDKPGNIIERVYTIRHNSAAAAGMRVNHGGDYYYIAAVLPDPTNAKHQLLMTRSAQNG
jgi:SPP1 family predicted phage head-tail adaptor